MTTYAPRHVDIWPWTKWKATTFVPTRTTGVGYLGLGVLDLDSPNNGGDYIAYDVALDSGVWTLNIIFQKNTDCGILTPSLGGVDMGSIDMYAASSVNHVYAWNNINILDPEFGPGVYELKLRTDTKHGSASDYDMMLQLITLTRTAAL